MTIVAINFDFAHQTRLVFHEAEKSLIAQRRVWCHYLLIACFPITDN